MSIIAYIVVSMAFGINAMLLFRICTAHFPMRLTRGLLSVLLMVSFHVLFFLLGHRLGLMLRFEDMDDAMLYQHSNDMVFLGMIIIVAIRWLLAIRRQTGYDVGSTSVLFSLAVISSIDPLFVGLADGFLAAASHGVAFYAIPLFLSEMLLGYWGVMMGRSAALRRGSDDVKETQAQLRPATRWHWISVLMLLSAAIFSMLGR